MANSIVKASEQTIKKMKLIFRLLRLKLLSLGTRHLRPTVTIRSNQMSAKPVFKTKRKFCKGIKSVFSSWLQLLSNFGDQIMNSEFDCTKYILIYGGCGGIGSKCVHQFKANNWWVASVDYTANNNADVNIMVSKHDDKQTQENEVLAALTSILQGKKLNVLICVAGSWSNITLTDNLVDLTEEMWNKNMQTSYICAAVATEHLANKGLFILSGAKTALTPSNQLVGYEAAKAAVNLLTKNLTDKSPEKIINAHIIALLPTVLESPNTKKLPETDASCRALQYISDLLVSWANGHDLPPSGSLCQLVANNSSTNVLIV